MNLAEFLLARIAEDGEDLDTARIPESPHWWMPDMWNEKRARAECEAKRRIVEELAYDGLGPREWLMKQLALPYADHPDYDESWRP